MSCIHKSLGELVGCSSATARRHLARLVELGGVSIRKYNGYVYAKFTKVRARKVQDKKHGMWWSPRYSDIILNEDNTTFATYKDIELALRALYIVDKQSTRNFFTQTMKIVGDPDRGVSAREIRSAKKRLHRYGIENFVDRGMSNKYLRRKLSCGTTTLKNVVSYGETIGLFERRLPAITFTRVGRGMGQEVYDYTDGEYTYYTRSCVAIVDGATRYALL